MGIDMARRCRYERFINGVNYIVNLLQRFDLQTEKSFKRFEGSQILTSLSPCLRLQEC